MIYYSPLVRAYFTERIIMKKNIHPKLNPIIFVDESTGKELKSFSTMTSDEIREVGGVKYFVVRLDVSSFSHPFFTGEMRFVDSQGRVDKFMQKLQKAQGTKATKKTKKQDDKTKNQPHKSYREILMEKQAVVRQTSQTAV